MLAIGQTANHEDVEEFQEREVSYRVMWGGRDDRVRGEGARMPYDVLGSPLLPHENRVSHGKERNLERSRS